MNIEELYRTYFDIVYRYIRSISQDGALAEEVTQETFFKALEKIDQFRGDCDVRVWLCQIAKNTLYDHLKKQKKQLLGDEKLEKIESAGGELLEEKLAQKQTLECQIAVLSYLTKSGSCPDLSGVALGGSIEELWEQLSGQNRAEKKCVEILPEDSPVGV